MNRIRALFQGNNAGLLGHWPSVWLLMGILLFASLTGCGGKKDETTGSALDEGEISISLTDAEGDFVSYTVDVKSLKLTRADGTVVDALPVKTRVDFAQYTDMTEFLTIATIPAGVYVKGSMVLDYSNAEILVENAAGLPVAVSGDNIKDSKGNVVTELNMSVKLEGRSYLRIIRGVPAHLALDFDLKESNTASFDGDVASIVVEPFLLAEVNIEKDRPHRVRGPLKEVQLDSNKFQVYVRPFTHYITRAQAHFGVLNVHANDETVYEIDGETYTGAVGLEQLASMAQYSAVTVIGDVKHLPRRFNAIQVYAGSSVPGGDLDVVQGSVMSRSGDVLTVKGKSFLRHNGSITFNDTVQVTLDASTTILKALKTETFGKDDISVGQYVTIFGDMGGTVDAKTLSAVNGYARMEISHVLGARIDAGEAPDYDFMLNVSRINGRDIQQYNFSGTGTDAANDADGSNYEVDHSVLDVSGIAVNDKVRVRGHVTPFGSAPADFDALTIISLPSSGL